MLIKVVWHGNYRHGSMHQKKRLCMCASFLFGTKALCALARDRRTVRVSIHQPSSEVFELLDQLYSLKDGKTVNFRQASDAYKDKAKLAS
ncbi:hypothetical protein AHAS_Ahas07G0144600 [Arachis hypogaea]